MYFHVVMYPKDYMYDQGILFDLLYQMLRLNFIVGLLFHKHFIQVSLIYKTLF